MTVNVYGGVPPLQVISIEPHCVSEPVPMLKLNARAGVTSAMTSADSSIMVPVPQGLGGEMECG